MITNLFTFCGIEYEVDSYTFSHDNNVPYSMRCMDINSEYMSLIPTPGFHVSIESRDKNIAKLRAGKTGGVKIICNGMMVDLICMRLSRITSHHDGKSQLDFDGIPYHNIDEKLAELINKHTQTNDDDLLEEIKNLLRAAM